MSGATLVILEGVDDILQTIYHEGEELRVVAIDEESGKVGLCCAKGPRRQGNS